MVHVTLEFEPLLPTFVDLIENHKRSTQVWNGIPANDSYLLEEGANTIFAFNLGHVKFHHWTHQVTYSLDDPLSVGYFTLSKNHLDSIQRINTSQCIFPSFQRFIINS
jgi:hypothetical protein